MRRPTGRSTIASWKLSSVNFCPLQVGPLPSGLVNAARLVDSRRRAEGDAEAVPAIDGHDRESEFRELFFGEFFPGQLEDFVRDVVLAHLRHRLGPGQGGPFALGVERRLSPGRQAVKTLLCFARGARV